MLMSNFAVYRREDETFILCCSQGRKEKENAFCRFVPRLEIKLDELAYQTN